MAHELPDSPYGGTWQQHLDKVIKENPATGKFGFGSGAHVFKSRETAARAYESYVKRTGTLLPHD